MSAVAEIPSVEDYLACLKEAGLPVTCKILANEPPRIADIPPKFKIGDRVFFGEGKNENGTISGVEREYSYGPYFYRVDLWNIASKCRLNNCVSRKYQHVFVHERFLSHDVSEEERKQKRANAIAKEKADYEKRRRDYNKRWGLNTSFP